MPSVFIRILLTTPVNKFKIVRPDSFCSRRLRTIGSECYVPIWVWETDTGYTFGFLGPTLIRSVNLGQKLKVCLLRFSSLRLMDDEFLLFLWGFSVSALRMSKIFSSLAVTAYYIFFTSFVSILWDQFSKCLSVTGLFELPLSLLAWVSALFH